MSEQQNYNRYEDEIDLKELFMVLWKKKLIIVSITLLFAILTGIFTMFFIDPVYEAKLDILVSIPETVDTKYGQYKMLMSTNEQYINQILSNDVLKLTMEEMNYNMSESSIESFANKISIIKDDKKPNSFTVKVKANSPEEALKVAKSLYKNFIDFLNVTVKTRSAEYFIALYTTELKKYEVNLELDNKLLEQYKDLLSKTPQTINQKDALNTLNINSIDYVVLENVLNENYRKIELDIINLEQQIYNLENRINISNQYIDELNQIKNDIATNGEFASEFFKVIDTSIHLPSEPVAPSQKTSPSTVLNVVIGAVIGGMLSVMYVLIKKYWFSESK